MKGESVMKKLGFLKFWNVAKPYVIVSVVLTVLLGAAFFLYPNRGHEVKSNDYLGTLTVGITTYDVRISEVWESNGYAIRTVELHPQGEPVYVSIVGHQYGCRINAWDEIFYGGQKSPSGSLTGYNSVVRDGAGWRFEPCPSDRGKVESFTEVQVFQAASLLDRAMAEFHNDEYCTGGFVWNEKEQRCERVSFRS
jgi:hypothetical protein